MLVLDYTKVVMARMLRLKHCLRCCGAKAEQGKEIEIQLVAWENSATMSSLC